MVLIRVLPYDPQWPVRFEQERALLERLLAPWLSAGVHHMGSTSVPGLAAKPVIDMIAGVDDLAAAQAAVPVLEGQSWVHAFHRPRALWFRKGTAEQPTHALHLTEPGSDLWQERFAFRDALRADPELQAEYQQLKHELAAAHPQDRSAYTAGKRELVARVLATAGIRLEPRDAEPVR
jgi:GrpB-like predicted nucleotidyltransferase (UPF0157 family)